MNKDKDELKKAKKERKLAIERAKQLQAEADMLERELVIAKARLKAKKSLEREHSQAYQSRKARNHALCVFASEVEAITKIKLHADDKAQLEAFKSFLEAHKEELITVLKE